jgi:hypothetical protein
MFLYHIPTYQFLELPGVKNPSSKSWLVEMRVWPLTRDSVAVKVSKDEANFEVKKERIVKNNKVVMEQWCLVVIDFMLHFGVVCSLLCVLTDIWIWAVLVSLS